MMTTILSKLSGFSAAREIQGTEPSLFSWDKKEYKGAALDLRDFAIFFKIKSLHDFSKLYEKEYAKYQHEFSRIKTWIKTFDKVPEEYFDEHRPFPTEMALSFLGAKNDLFYSWIKEVQEIEVFNKFFNYYLDNKESFFLLRDMTYDVITKEGKQTVNLEFAENFRFKSAQDSFNLFNMPTGNRDVVIPQKDNHFIYMVDYRQFEFRTFLTLVDADVDFEDNDLYGHIGEKLGLEDPKIELISYLYSARKDENIKKVIDKDKMMDNLKENYFLWKDYPVYFRKDFEDNKKIHSIIQTISYFIYLKKFSKVLELLKGYESSLIFPLHDAMIFSVSTDEMELVEKIPQLLVDDHYKVKQYIGKNLKEVEEL